MRQWLRYEQQHGGGSCMTKNFAELKELVMAGKKVKKMDFLFVIQYLKKKKKKKNEQGVPNALRAEVWKITSGASNKIEIQHGKYEALLKEHAGEESVATEEIGRDLVQSFFFFKKKKN